MKRIAAPLLAVLLACLPLAVRPLGLGEIELRSHLNARLDARIVLHSLKAGDVDGMRVNLGNAEQFRRAGLDRPFVLSRLRFEVVDTGEAAFIRVTTQEPLAEPFLNFLLEVDWPNGRVLREYTLLLDPPVYGAAITAHVTETVPTAAAPPPAPSSAPGAAASRGGTRAAGATLQPGGTYGPVGATDTLWSLADRFRAGSSLSIQQMMLAMLRSNPDAFSQGNINLLREGSVLRIPTQAEAEAVTQAAALVEVQRQHAAWEEFRRSVGTGVARAPAGQSAAASTGAPASPPAAPGSEDPARADRLKLVSGGTAQGGVGSVSEQSAEISTLREELERSRESADASRRESEELAGRLEEAEAVIKELERLVKVQSGELESLQRKLAESATAMAAAPAAPAAPVTQAEAPAKKPVPLPPAAPKPSGVLDLVRSRLDFLPVDPILFIGGVLVLVVLAVVAVIFSRRRKSEGRSEGPEEAEDDVQLEITADPAATQIMLAGEAPEDVPPEAPTEPPADDEPTEIPPEQRTGRSQPAAEDPLAEVNVYLAYERFEQAETVVKNAIEEHPDRPEYRLKLLEVHHAAKNVVGFAAAAAVLQAAVGDDSEMMTSARQWWEELAPGRDLASAGQGGGEPGATDDVFDVTSAGVPPGASETTTQLSGGVDTSGGIDFDLGLDAGEEEALGEGTNVDFDLGAEEASEERVGGSTTVDFDLGLDDEAPGGGTDLDFELSSDDASAPAPADDDDSLDFTLDDDAASEPEPESEEDAALDFVLDDDTAPAEEPPGSSTDLDFVLDDDALEAEPRPGGETDVDFDIGDFAETTTEAPLRAVSPPANDDDAGGDDDLDVSLELDSLAETSELPSLDAPGTDAPLEFDLEIPGSEPPTSDTEETGLDIDFAPFEEDAADGALDTVELSTPSEAGEGSLTLEIPGEADDDGPDAPVIDLDESTADLGDIDLVLDSSDDAAADGAPESLEIDDDFAELFTEDGDGAGDADAPSAGGAVAGELTELDLDLADDSGLEDPTERPSAGSPGQDPDLDLDALLLDDDSGSGDVFDDVPIGSADDGDDEVTDLNLGEFEAAAEAAGDGGVLDLELGGLGGEEPDASGTSTDGLDFDFDDLELDAGELGEPEDDTIEPIDDESEEAPDSEDRTLVLGRGASGEIEEVQTKLDLAQAYIDMGDGDGAKGILGEVMAEGNEAQRAEAETLLKGID